MNLKFIKAFDMKTSYIKRYLTSMPISDTQGMVNRNELIKMAWNSLRGNSPVGSFHRRILREGGGDSPREELSWRNILLGEILRETFS